jgi:hypothetical protein
MLMTMLAKAASLLTPLMFNGTLLGCAVLCRAGKYQKLLFALAYFHSVLLERRKFRMLGLNIAYDFNDTDFRWGSRRAGALAEQHSVHRLWHVGWETACARHRVRHSWPPGRCS